MDVKTFWKDNSRNIIPGDVFQIIACKFDDAYNGCLVLCTEAKEWGIVGEISFVENTYPDGLRDAKGLQTIQVSMPLRLKYEELEHVGLAPLVPAD